MNKISIQILTKYIDLGPIFHTGIQTKFNIYTCSVSECFLFVSFVIGCLQMASVSLYDNITSVQSFDNIRSELEKVKYSARIKPTFTLQKIPHLLLLPYMMSMNNDRLRSMIIARAMNIDRYDH